MSFTMTDIQSTRMKIKRILDRRGNEVQLKAGTTLAWMTDNSNILALTPEADGLSCLVQTIGPLGNVKVFLKGQGADGSTISGVIEVEIISSAPTNVEIDPGVPEDMNIQAIRKVQGHRP